MEQRESPCDVNGSVNWCRYQGKQYAEFLKIRSTIKLPYDATVPLLIFYSKETKTLTQRDISIPIFIAVFFILAETWKQPVSMYEWIKNVVYIHNRIVFILSHFLFI